MMFFGAKLYLGNIIVFARSPSLFMHIFPLIVNIIQFAETLINAHDLIRNFQPQRQHCVYSLNVMVTKTAKRKPIHHNARSIPE